LIWIADLINPLANTFGVDPGVPKKAPPKPKPPYRRKPPQRVASDKWHVTGKTKPLYRKSPPRAATVDSGRATSDFSHPHLLAPSHFTLL
jgi:hypothetical protein